MFKNNGFKKVVKNIIAAQCKDKEFNISSVDVSRQEIVFYIFDLEWYCLATIKAYFMENEISISASTDTSSLVGITNKPYSERCKYLEFNRANELITEVFNKIVEDEINA